MSMKYLQYGEQVYKSLTSTCHIGNYCRLMSLYNVCTTLVILDDVKTLLSIFMKLLSQRIIRSSQQYFYFYLNFWYAIFY